MRKQLLRQYQIIEKHRFLLLQIRSTHPSILIQHLIFHRFQFDCRNEIVSHKHTVFLILHCIFLRKSLYFHGENRFKTCNFHIGALKKFSVQNGVPEGVRVPKSIDFKGFFDGRLISCHGR